MDTVAWKFISDQVAVLTDSGVDEMKELAKECRTKEVSGLEGYKVTVNPNYLMNGDLVVRVEASKKRMFGYLTQSITGGFEVSAGGELTVYKEPIKAMERTAVRERWDAMANS